MRILSLLLILIAISKSHAAFQTVLFTGAKCNGENNKVTVDSTNPKCVNICGGYYGVTSANDVYTLHQYTGSDCSDTDSKTETLTCGTDNAPFTLTLDNTLLIQCTDSSTGAPENKWINYKLTAGPSGHTCDAAGVYFGVASGTECINGCGGSFRVSRPYSAPTANHFQFNFYNQGSCAGTAAQTTDFMCGAEGVNVALQDFQIACSTAATPTPTGTPTNSPTATPTNSPTTGSATNVVVNITLLFAALLFLLL